MAIDMHPPLRVYVEYPCQGRCHAWLPNEVRVVHGGWHLVCTGCRCADDIEPEGLAIEIAENLQALSDALAGEHEPQEQQAPAPWMPSADEIRRARDLCDAADSILCAAVSGDHGCDEMIEAIAAIQSAAIALSEPKPPAEPS